MSITERIQGEGDRKEPTLASLDFSPRAWLPYDEIQDNGEIIRTINLEGAKNVARRVFKEQGVYTEQVETALQLADEAHKDKVRKVSKDPYFVHPLMTAIAVAHATKDSSVVAAALCHDVIEDSPEDQYGNKIYTPYVIASILANRDETDKAVQLIVALTSDETYDKTKVNPRSREGERLAENQKAAAVYKAINHSPEAVLIKTGDFLSNITDFVNDYKQIGQQTFDAFDYDKFYYLRRFTDGLEIMALASITKEGWEVNQLLEPAIKKQLRFITMCKEKSLSASYGIMRDKLLFILSEIAKHENNR